MNFNLEQQHSALYYYLPRKLVGVTDTGPTIALSQILETVVIFHFSGGKVYSLNKGCHTCMIKHTMHVQLLHCSITLTWLDMCIYRPKLNL